MTGEEISKVDKESMSSTDMADGYADEEDDDFSLAKPDEMSRFESDDAERDLLGEFIKAIQYHLTECEDENMRIISANERKIVIDVNSIIDFRDVSYRFTGERREDFLQEMRIIFERELPNIIQLYESVGWTVNLDDNEDCMLFKGKLTDSPYRKLLETIQAAEKVGVPKD